MPTESDPTRNVLSSGRPRAYVGAVGLTGLALLLRLREIGCDDAEGWYLSRAEPAEVLTPWLLRRPEQADLAV